MTAAGVFLSIVGARRGLWLLLLLCAAGVAACELAIPWLLQHAVDAALGDGDGQRLDVLGGAMLGVIAALYALHTLLLRVETRVLYDGLFRLRRRVYTHVLGQPLAYFTRMKSGELVHRVVNDTGVLEDNAAELFSDLPFEVLTVAGVVTLMAVTDPRLGAIVVGFLLAASAVSSYLGRPLPTLRKQVQTVAAGFSSRLQEALTGIRTVKAFGRERHEMARLDEGNRRITELEVRGGRVGAWLDPVFDLMELLGVVLVVWYGAHLIIDKRITPGVLVAFMAYMEILAGPVSRAGKFYRHLQHCRGVCERLATFLNDGERVRPHVTPSSTGAARPAAPIAFETVGFSYPGSARPAIDGVSFTVTAGELVALVGRNGAGKSTLMDLLLRFHLPSRGRITVGGRDLREWDGDVWRRTVGVMPQDVFLFHASVAENIAYGRPEATAEEIEASAMKAGLGELVARLPSGLATVVGDRGSRLSGGERQRIALARLFLLNPAVLVFDEPTAHLDGEALAAVGDAIAKLSVGRTTFVIAHRPETIRLADRVVLMDGGCLVADGTHDDLLAHMPLYATLLASLQKTQPER